MFVLCLTSDGHPADLASRELQAGLSLVDLGVGTRLWVTPQRWRDLDLGASGPCRAETVTRIATERVAEGRRLPTASRAELSATFRGDPGSVEAELPFARHAASSPTSVTERQWLTNVLEEHASRGRPLTDVAAARALLAVHDRRVSDAALFRISRPNAVEQQAFWTDLTRRAPDDVRTPAAALAAFASWQAGDGAAAWCALDRIPADRRDYPVARLMDQVLREGVNPAVWEDSLAAADQEHPARAACGSTLGTAPGRRRGRRRCGRRSSARASHPTPAPTLGPASDRDRDRGRRDRLVRHDEQRSEPSSRPPTQPVVLATDDSDQA